MCAIAIGTETNGSIVCPSSANGIVGIKPTVGLWSRDGIIPISHTQDTAGPMARSVYDAAVLLGQLAGVDPSDSRTSESNGNSYTDYTQFLDPQGLKGKRIGVLKNVFGYHEAVDKIFTEVVENLESAGAAVIRDIELDGGEGFGNAGFEVLLYEFKDGVNKYLQSRTDSKVKSLAGIIEFNQTNRSEEMPFFEQEILELAESKGSLDDSAYKEALNTILSVSRGEIDRALEEDKLDAIIGVTGGPAWPIDVINGDHFGTGSSTFPARSGYPNISIPAGYVHGLPVGLSIFGGKYQEPKLLGIAYAYEQATKVRKAPQFLPAIDLS
jgi:amidase